MTNVRKEARELAEQYLELLWDDSVPVDPVLIARGLGMQVMKADLPEDTAGALQKRKGADAVIFVDRDDHRNRQRFTIAHAIGHYAFRIARGEEEIDFRDLRDQMASRSTDDEEVFANEFAASLLMPRRRMLELRGPRQGRPDPDVLLLASRFRVSEEAMSYRLRNLDSH